MRGSGRHSPYDYRRDSNGYHDDRRSGRGGRYHQHDSNRYYDDQRSRRGGRPHGPPSRNYDYRNRDDHHRRYYESASSRDADRHPYETRPRYNNRDRPYDHSGRSTSPSWETVPRRRRSSPREESPSVHASIKPDVPLYVPPNDTNTKFEKFMIILVGVPGSGKSTFAQALATAMPYKYVRINQDALGNRQACEEKCRKILSQGKCPVIDRCNFDPKQRKHFLDIAQEAKVKVDAVVFTYPMEECVARCQARRDHETIKPRQARGVVERMVQSFYPPLPERKNAENYRNLHNVTDVTKHNDLVLEYLNSALF